MKIAKKNKSPQPIKKVEASSLSEHGQAVEHVRKAIHLLGIKASTDPVAKEAIGNLSVVLFELQGTKKKK